MIKKIVSLSFIAMLGACASPAKYDWVKPGASDTEKVNARSECQYQIKLGKTPMTEYDELLKLCMQGKGFRVTRIN